MTVGERIRYRRKELDLTLEQIAKTIKVSKQTVQRYESGVISNIPPDKIEVIAKVLGVTPAYIMGWDSENKFGKQEALEDYLKSLGYIIDSIPAKNENGKWIELEYKQFDENGKLQLPPNLRRKPKISKGKESVILTNEEFKELQDNIENIANYEIDKLFKNKG